MPKKQEQDKEPQAEAVADVEVVAWTIEPPADIAYYYNADENPTGLRFQGVPLRDMTATEFEKLPEWKQRQIKKAKFYSNTPPGESKGGNK
jgi:hypothetical protein